MMNKRWATALVVLVLFLLAGAAARCAEHQKAWASAENSSHTMINFRGWGTSTPPDSIAVLKQKTGITTNLPRTIYGWDLVAGYEGTLTPAPDSLGISVKYDLGQYVVINWPVELQVRSGSGKYQIVNVLDETGLPPAIYPVVLSHSATWTATATSSDRLRAQYSIETQVPSLVRTDLYNEIGQCIYQGATKHGPATSHAITDTLPLLSIGGTYTLKAVAYEAAYDNLFAAPVSFGAVVTPDETPVTIAVASSAIADAGACPGARLFWVDVTIQVLADIQVRWRANGDSEWTGQTTVTDAMALQHHVLCVHYESCAASVGTDYEVEVQFTLQDGATKTAWIPIGTVTF